MGVPKPARTEIVAKRETVSVQVVLESTRPKRIASIMGSTGIDSLLRSRVSMPGVDGISRPNKSSKQ